MPTPKGTIPWNAGTSKGWTDKRGYRWIYVVENGKRRAKRELRHVMEQHLGRKLANEELVHHVNGDKSDNRLENLELSEWGTHTAEHHHGSRHTEYAKQTQSVLAGYREDVRRLESLNAELLEALEEAVDLAWIVDSHQVQFDPTVVFSQFYDFSGLDGVRRIEFYGQHSCIVWPGSKWSAYCTYDGSMWFEKFDTAAEAKEACMRLLDQVLPDHPAMRARAAIAKAKGEQQ